MARAQLLSSSLIDKMVADAAFHEFPLCKNPPPETFAGRGCKPCQKKKNRAPLRLIDYNEFKLQFMSLPTAQQEAIKQRLKVVTLQVQYRDRRGKVITSLV